MDSRDELNFDYSISRLNNYISQCDYCSNIFESKRPNMYCSNSCRQRAYYVRNGLRNDFRKNKPSDCLSSATGRILGFHKSKNPKIMQDNDQTGSHKTTTNTGCTLNLL